MAGFFVIRNDGDDHQQLDQGKAVVVAAWQVVHAVEFWQTCGDAASSVCKGGGSQGLPKPPLLGRGTAFGRRILDAEEVP